MISKNSLHYKAVFKPSGNLTRMQASEILQLYKIIPVNKINNLSLANMRQEIKQHYESSNKEEVHGLQVQVQCATVITVVSTQRKDDCDMLFVAGVGVHSIRQIQVKRNFFALSAQPLRSIRSGPSRSDAVCSGIVVLFRYFKHWWNIQS